MAGVQACQNLQEGAIRRERRYHDHPVSPGKFRPGPADRDRARRRAAHVGRGAESGSRCFRRWLCRRDLGGWTPAGGQTWARPGTVDPDRDRRARCPAAEGARPVLRYPCRSEGALHLEHPAEMGTAVAQSRCAAAGAVPARHFDRRLPGGAERAPGAGGGEPVARGDHAADSRLAGNLRRLAAPRSFGAPLRLYMG